MNNFNLTIAILTLVVIVLGLVYKQLKRSVLNETLLAVLAGIVLGPYALDILHMGEPEGKEQLMRQTCKLTIAMALMATAFRIPDTYLSRYKKVQGLMLLAIMPLMFLASACIIHFVGGLPWLPGLLIGAIITPTDPVLAGTIITGETAERNLPEGLRTTLSFESGANDGLAYPLVMLCLLLIEKPEYVWYEWLTKTLLWETGGAIVCGLLLGYAFGHLLKLCIKKKLTGKPAILAFAMAVAIFVLTSLELIGVNGILAVFVTGLILKRVLTRQEDLEEMQVQEMMARLFTIPVFVFFGFMLPWQQWAALGWRAFTIPVFILLLRRLPAVLLFTPLLKRFRLKETLFMGWFGPIGAAALFYCFLTYQKLHLDEIWTYTSLVVFSSVVVHGVTAYPFLSLYGKYTRNTDNGR